MKVALLGDIAFLGRCSIAGNSDINGYFSEVAYYLSNFDYVVGNLETPFSAKKQIYGAKSAYIYSDPENISLLKMLHIDAVTLANNHIFDYGCEGYMLTKEILRDSGIDYFGVDGKELKIEKDGNKIAFIGLCCYSTNPQKAVPYGMKGVNEFNVAKVEEIFRENVKEGFLNVLALHTGKEHVNYPSLDSIKVARKFAEISPYIYYGCHPHVAQGLEKYKESLIAYSLGNFCFDDVYIDISTEPLVKLSENNRSSFILIVDIEKNIIKSYETVPIFIGKDKIYIGKGTSNSDLKKYKDAIHNLSEKDYEALRNKDINSYYGKRKSQRDIIWYLKRLRPRYFRLFFTNKINAKKYSQCVKQFLRNE